MKVGILCGREYSFPPAFVEKVNELGASKNITAEFVKLGGTRMGEAAEYRVFVDGRADLYGDDLLRQFRTALQLRTGWRDILDRWTVEALLVPPSCALAQALLLDPNWHATFIDSKAVILLRTHPPPVERRASSPVTVTG